MRGVKCAFAKHEVRYLGRLISANGYRPDPEETTALERFRDPPKTVGELRSLLGFLGYYRTYVNGFASRVKPMYDLLKGKISGGKDGKKVGQLYNSREKVVWSSELQEILDSLLDYLKSPEVMAYPNYDLPFFMTTDASGYGLGSVLYQNQHGIDRVIGFASRTLSDSEQRYHFHSGKLEFLALKWSVTERFKDYLQFGPPFVVFTDNNPLTYVLSSAKLNAVALRWVNDLADYNFTIKYRPGKINVDADYLSRRPMDIEELKRGCTETVDHHCLDAVLKGVNHSSESSPYYVSVSKLSLEGEACTSVISREVLVEEQKSDAVIGPVYAAVEEERRPARKLWSTLRYESKLLMQNWNKLKVVAGVLMRETVRGLQVVLPSKYRQVVYTELHEKLAHLGADRVLELARQRFFWPKMARDIQNYVQKKCKCVADKRPNVPERAKMMSIESSYPFEVVAIDFIHLDKCKGGFEYVLVVTDLFTKFVQMYGTKKKSSKAAASKLFHEFVLSYGFPKRIMHDKGGEFNSGLFEELHRLSGIEASNTTPYHPMSNGQCERMNRSLVSMLKSLSPAEKRDWKSVLPKLSFAYNSTQHASTGFTPFFMMFGRESRLPIDELFEEVQVESEGKLKCKTHQQFVDEWRQSMQEAFRLAKEKSEKAQAYNKEKYDGKVREIGISEGDHVLVRNLRETGGTGKLRSYWEHQIFKVVSQQGDLPVYQVQSLDKARDVRVLHRNHLMRCDELPINVFKEIEDLEKHKKEKPSKRPKHKERDIHKSNQQAAEELVEEESDESERSEADLEVQLDIYPQHKDSLTEAESTGRSEIVERIEDDVVEEASVAIPPITQVPDTIEEAEEVGEEEMEEGEEDVDDAEEETEEEIRRRPIRERRAPKVLTYPELGKPSYSGGS